MRHHNNSNNHEGLADESDALRVLQQVRAAIICDEITLTDNWVIELPRLEAREDQPQTLYVDLNEYVLPANGFFRAPLSLADRWDLSGAVVLAVDRYVTASKNSKSRSARVKSVVARIALFFEYMWVNDIVTLKMLEQTFSDELPRKLANGGWSEVLQIPRRVAALDDSEIPELLKRKSAKGRGGAYFKNHLHTNSRGFLNSFQTTEQGLELDGLPEEINSEEAPLTITTIAETLGIVNYLYDIGPRFGTTFLPFPNPVAIAARFGRAGGRTDNINIKTAGRLIRESIKWIYNIAPHVLLLLEEIVVVMEQHEALTLKWINRLVERKFTESEHRKAMENLLPFEIGVLDLYRGKRKGEVYSLREIILCLMSACFVNIATMNARRKDEIRHPKFGLQKGNLAVVDEILGIFTVNFYIEKTYLQRMPFYVNRSTCDAIKILESLEELFSRMESIIKPQQKLSSESRPLFSYRRISTKRGVLANRRWYDFTNFAHDADAKLFLRCALGNESSFSIKAHMFRRMYALLMMYRYENGDLQSAMYQLGHFDANMTMLYVTDPSGRPAMEQISQTIGNTNRELRAVIYEEHARTIHKEIRQVGEEKFVEDVYQILTGEVAHGGYTKYIRRLQINLSKQIRFATLSTEEKANELVRVAKTRGHFPKPMPHGQCMAGGARNIHMAKCHSNNENRLQHELASHETCNGCVFHLTKMAYLRNLEGELQLLRTHMATDPVRDCGKSPYQAEVENLELVLNLMSSRLMGDASA